MIKLFQPYISDIAKNNVQRVLSGTQIAQGPEVDLFEKEFAERFGFEEWQIVSLNSGTSALELAYELTEIEENDTVITPILTCTATNIPLLRRKANIVFADISAKSLNADFEDVQMKIDESTKAIVFVHFGGSSENLEEFENIAEEEGVDLICDAAQALGSKLSTKARFSCISLQAIKSLTAGDGGILICRDREDALKARKLRWFGYDREIKQLKGDTDLKLAGYKMHMNDISAAIARGNLAEWDKIQLHRMEINEIYTYHYGMYERDGINLCSGIWNPYVTGMDYKEMKFISGEHDFEIGQHHYRNDKYSIFKSSYSNCPNMDALGDNYFMLPCHMGMTLEDAEMIAKTIWPS